MYKHDVFFVQNHSNQNKQSYLLKCSARTYSFKATSTDQARDLTQFMGSIYN